MEMCSLLLKTQYNKKKFYLKICKDSILPMHRGVDSVTFPLGSQTGACQSSDSPLTPKADGTERGKASFQPPNSRVVSNLALKTTQIWAPG